MDAIRDGMERDDMGCWTIRDGMVGYWKLIPAV